MVSSVHQYESIKHKNGEVATIILMHKIILMLLCDNTWKYLNQNLNILIKSFIFLFPPTFIIFVTCLSLIFIILKVFSYQTKISNQVFISISNRGSLLIFFLTNLSNPTFKKKLSGFIQYVMYFIILMILLAISAKHKNIKV